MPAARFTPPNHWEDWCSWGLGIWLCISPWALRFDLEPASTRAAVVTGVLLILVEAITLSAFRAWEEWINVLLGVWLIAAPWIVATTSGAATADFVVVGLLVLALAIYEIRNPEKAENET
jgi:SPW repeat